MFYPLIIMMRPDFQCATLRTKFLLRDPAEHCMNLFGMIRVDLR